MANPKTPTGYIPRGTPMLAAYPVGVISPTTNPGQYPGDPSNWDATWTPRTWAPSSAIQPWHHESLISETPFDYQNNQLWQPPPSAPQCGTGCEAPPSEQLSQSAVKTSLYVGDLHKKVTDDLLYGKFGGAGQIHDIRVCRNKLNGESLGYAYINFANRADAEIAMETFNYDPFFGRPMRIMWADTDPARRRSPKGNLFVRNLDRKITTKHLYKMFSTFGAILSCKIVTNDSQVSKGYGFVHFESERAAGHAMNTMNGFRMDDNGMEVAWFKPRGVQKVEYGQPIKNDENSNETDPNGGGTIPEGGNAQAKIGQPIKSGEGDQPIESGENSNENDANASDTSESGSTPKVVSDQPIRSSESDQPVESGENSNENDANASDTSESGSTPKVVSDQPIRSSESDQPVESGENSNENDANASDTSESGSTPKVVSDQPIRSSESDQPVESGENSSENDAKASGTIPEAGNALKVVSDQPIERGENSSENDAKVGGTIPEAGTAKEDPPDSATPEDEPRPVDDVSE